ncbi:MAG TPA: TetR/AcrR family transcriptional regulator [Polyangiaceae bacterium]|nr:TetR/AcrR family transcriptional regulator [Polyangiaceae bacterium]
MSKNGHALKPTRKEVTEITRRKLIDGAIEILRREGVAAATTGRIAAAAGLKQPSFYVHFKDRDEIIGAAAAEIGQRMLDRLQRQITRYDPAHARASLRQACNAMFGAFLAEPELTRIFLRHRNDDETVLGRVFGRFVQGARAQLRDAILASPRRVARVSPQTADASVEVVVAALLGLLEGLVYGRVDDIDVAADVMTRMTAGVLRPLLAAPAAAPYERVSAAARSVERATKGAR